MTNLKLSCDTTALYRARCLHSTFSLTFKKVWFLFLKPAAHLWRGSLQRSPWVAMKNGSALLNSAQNLLQKCIFFWAPRSKKKSCHRHPQACYFVNNNMVQSYYWFIVDINYFQLTGQLIGVKLLHVQGLQNAKSFHALRNVSKWWSNGSCI